MKDNVDNNVAICRDAFLSAERTYVNELLKYDAFNSLVEEYKNRPSDEVFTLAKNVLVRVETGQVPNEDLERAEALLLVLFSAIEDKVVGEYLVKKDSHPKAK